MRECLREIIELSSNHAECLVLKARNGGAIEITDK